MRHSPSTLNPAAATGDPELSHRVLAGDADAVAEVRRWVRGASSPYRLLLAAELEDLEQEVLIELIEALRQGRFRGDSTLPTYVRRMVHYKCLNRCRARRRRHWVDVADLALESAEPTPFETAAARDSRDVALRVVTRMSEECRRLWGMILDGRSYEEMSASLGVAAGTLRVRVLRCRRKAVAELDRVTKAAPD